MTLKFYLLTLSLGPCHYTSGSNFPAKYDNHTEDPL